MKIPQFTVLTPPKILCTSVPCAIHNLTEYYSHFACEHVYFNAMTLFSFAFRCLDFHCSSGSRCCFCTNYPFLKIDFTSWGAQTICESWIIHFDASALIPRESGVWNLSRSGGDVLDRPCQWYFKVFLMGKTVVRDSCIAYNIPLLKVESSPAHKSD